VRVVFHNILIVKPSSLGDVVHGLPVLVKLRRTFPGARISWLVGMPAAAIVEGNPNLNEVIYFRRRAGGLFGTARAQAALLRKLRRGKFDCVVDLQGLLRSALFSAATRAPVRIGLSDAREGARWFYTDVVEVGARMHAVDRYLAVGKVLGFDSAEPEFALEALPEARQSVERMLGAVAGVSRPFFALSLGARWASKEWPAENFAAAGSELLERFGGTVFLVGAADAARRAREVEERMEHAVVNLVGRTSVGELVALISKMDLVVATDTGILHIADALGRKVVGIFGPNDPARSAPYFQRENVLTAEGRCPKAPCMEHECDGMDMICMKSVTGDDVVRRARVILEGGI